MIGPRLLATRAVQRPWGGDGLPAYGLGTPPGERVGEWWVDADEFPLLVKVIDAREDLSIQMHPDDAQAQRLGVGANGKTEAWYVLAARPGSRLLLGLRADQDVDAFLAAAERGEDVSWRLATCSPGAGSFVLVPAHTVHAIGAGYVLLEIQQRSDVTFRVFDWNREPRRTLHLAQARAVLTSGPPPRPAAPSPDGVACPYFAATRVRGISNGPALALDAARPEMLFCAAGSGVVHAAGVELAVGPGAFCLVPAGPYAVRPTSDLELVRLQEGPQDPVWKSDSRR